MLPRASSLPLPLRLRPSRHLLPRLTLARRRRTEAFRSLAARTIFEAMAYRGSDAARAELTQIALIFEPEDDADALAEAIGGMVSSVHGRDSPASASAFHAFFADIALLDGRGRDRRDGAGRGVARRAAAFCRAGRMAARAERDHQRAEEAARARASAQPRAGRFGPRRSRRAVSFWNLTGRPGPISSSAMPARANPAMRRPSSGSKCLPPGRSPKPRMSPRPGPLLRRAGREDAADGSRRGARCLHSAGRADADLSGRGGDRRQSRRLHLLAWLGPRVRRNGLRNRDWRRSARSAG